MPTLAKNLGLLPSTSSPAAPVQLAFNHCLHSAGDLSMKTPRRPSREVELEDIVWQGANSCTLPVGVATDLSALRIKTLEGFLPTAPKVVSCLIIL